MIGGRAPGDGSDWEVRVYEKTNTRSFILKSKQSIHVSTKKTSEQTIRVHPPLNIRRGQYIGLVNKSGRLSLTYTRGWSTQRGGAFLYCLFVCLFWLFSLFSFLCFFLYFLNLFPCC